MKVKNPFVIYENWAQMLINLPNDKSGELIKTICIYRLTGKIQAEDPVIKGVFMSMKEQLDKDTAKYQEKVKNLNKNRLPKSDRNQNEIGGNNNNININTSSLEDVPPISPTEKELVQKSNISEPLADAVADWVAYKKERNERFTTSEFKALLSRAEQAEQQHGASAVIGIITDCMASGYKGITWDKLKASASNNKTTSFEEMLYQV